MARHAGDGGRCGGAWVSGVRLVISDVDGTLVGSDKRLSPRTVAAVAALRRRGIGFTVVSSRPPFGLRRLARELGLALPLAAFNGGALVTPALEPLDESLVPRDAAAAALACFAGCGVDAWLFTAREWLVRDPAGAYVDLERRTVETDPVAVASFADSLDGVGKLVGVSADFAGLAACEARMAAALAGRASIARSQNYYLDVTPPATDKGTAVAALSRRLGVPAADIVTLGDMENDVPMFRQSGFSIAMGNAAAAVKAAARAVTATNDEDGFAAAVERLILPRAGGC